MKDVTPDFTLKPVTPKTTQLTHTSLILSTPPTHVQQITVTLYPSITAKFTSVPLFTITVPLYSLLSYNRFLSLKTLYIMANLVQTSLTALLHNLLPAAYSSTKQALMLKTQKMIPPQDPHCIKPHPYHITAQFLLKMDLAPHKEHLFNGSIKTTAKATRQPKKKSQEESASLRSPWLLHKLKNKYDPLDNENRNRKQHFLC